MACGCLMLTDDRSEASRLFEDGAEIAIYLGTEDLRHKVFYDLAHPDRRRAIAEAGRRKVLTHHTYTARLQTVEPLMTRFVKESRPSDVSVSS